MHMPNACGGVEIVELRQCETRLPRVVRLENRNVCPPRAGAAARGPAGGEAGTARTRGKDRKTRGIV